MGVSVDAHPCHGRSLSRKERAERFLVNPLPDRPAVGCWTFFSSAVPQLARRPVATGRFGCFREAAVQVSERR